MKQIKIEGKHELSGTIKVSGAKNSAVALIPASILADDVVSIDNIPNISDIDALIEILNFLNVKVEKNDTLIKIDPTALINKEIPKEVSSKLRASYYFMAALLGKYKYVEMYFPGGCQIGSRPIDQTLKGFETLGATVEEKDNKFIIKAEKLVGANVYLDMPSVGATINTMLVAVKAQGTTIIDNAAKEPEIVNVATYLNNMGAKISGAGTSEIKITGVEHLNGCFSEVIPDRIEAGTYILAGALLGNNLKIDNIIPEHVESLLLKLKEIGISMDIKSDYLIINKCDNMKKSSIRTLGYPGFPTDLQQPITTLLTQCKGESIIEETIYENRFQNVPYLNNMGANITIDGNKIKISGPTQLIGKEVVATDLRAGACLVLAGLIAEGITTITNVEHVLRGYEDIIEKLTNVGAKIKYEEI